MTAVPPDQSRPAGTRAFGPGRIIVMAVAYLVQHGETEPAPGDPGLTPAGRQQASRTGRWLHGRGVHAVYTSPLRRARETADCIASVTGLAVQPDARLRERLTWDGSTPYEAFLALWARTTNDRDFVPPSWGSSRQAGAQLQAFLAGLPGTPGPVAVVTHGGITTDLLRNVLEADALPPQLLAAGIPPCAITTIDDLTVAMIASTAHLS